MSFAEPRFSLNERQVDARTAVVVVGGEIHVSTAPEFRRQLNASVSAGHHALVLDMTAVSFIDSTGLSVLLTTLRRLGRVDGRLAIVCTNPTVLRLFEITHLDKTFDLHADMASALEAVQPAGGRSAGAP